MSSAPPPARLTLYGAANSDCSTRLRIALAYKRLSYEYIDMHANTDFSEEYATQVNPSRSIPTLVVRDSDSHRHAITQSMAALEFLEEDISPPTFPLLPTSPVPLPGGRNLSVTLARAHVRALATILAADTHPLTAPKVEHRLVAQFLGGDGAASGAGSSPESSAETMKHKERIKEWRKFWIQRGLEAYERTVSPTSGKYSVGDNLSLADVCLIVQVWRARSYVIDMRPYPTIAKIVASIGQLEAVMGAHWDAQLKDR